MDIDQKIKKAQSELQEHDIDAWLLYDFHGINPIANHFLQVPKKAHLTRRYFYLIPKKGDPIKLVHRIEPNHLNHLPGKKVHYFSWKQLKEKLQMLLADHPEIAMEYSPEANVPTISKIDAGTIEMIRSIGGNVVSSGAFLQTFTNLWDDAKYKSHQRAMSVIYEARDKAYAMIKDAAKKSLSITEFDVQKIILGVFAEHELVLDGGPIVAFSENGADPHFETKEEGAKVLKEGDTVLFDMWGKMKGENSVFADITQMAVFAKKPTERQQEIFQVVRDAQKSGLDFIKRRLERDEVVKGFEVDEIVRDVIKSHDLDLFFTHRTGHNIDVEAHGPGANLDSIETLDERPLVKGTCFSIEPGIYLPDEFGIRLELDVFIHLDGRVEVTGGEQNEFFCLL